MTKNVNYTAKDIKILDTIEGIRQRTGMYLGSTDQEGVKHCVLEIASNSIDEALNGHGKEVTIKLDTKENMATVSDFGRGVPFDKMEDGVPAVVAIFTNTHAGGKFDAGNYSVSGGLI